MKAIRTLMVAALATAGLAATVEVYADAKHGWRGGGSHAGRHWDGGARHWRGGTRHFGGHRNFGGHRHFRGHTNFGLSIGVPLFYGAYAWGPWYDPWYGPTVVYREREVIPEIVEVEREPTTEVPPRGEGAPTSGPLYMNYCASAKAYYPKVTSCPEGWKFIAPTQ